MSLFQTSVINKYLKGLDNDTVTKAWEKFTTHFHDPTIQSNIRSSKEEQYQEGFLIDLFVKVFGYIKNPTPEFNLTTELKNVRGAKKTDGAILSGETALAVIELKGTNTTDLGKVEGQAFGYKNNQPGCVYVITSNFEKLRFYIDNAVDYEEFNLFKITRERFNLLWLCLNQESLLKNVPKQIKDESLTVEENITKQLYKDYSLFRNEIFASIQKNNPDYDKLTLFKKTQKLLDRFLFIFFAEDRLLLPPNSIRSIIDQWTTLKDELDAYSPLYSRFKKYFGYMNTGHQGKKHDIFAYNGGLFAPDEILDNIKIDDGLLYVHTQKLSNYDFESEVSVNILGHIFEHSLNEIEEIQAEIEGIETDKSKSKRKKDGVFYTPKYITKYIVDNTVGKLCEEQKTALDIQEEEYEKDRKGRKKATLKALVKKLEDYRNWLLDITICDPACGSGAFLNQSLEFLITEHRYIDELQAKLLGESMVLSEVENSILENNLFGVDINEESVEIAKLSLWLRTAQKGRKLTTLNDNIKCGNSLIDDPEVAGEKAFKWEQEFPQVFENGGFDVVVGNPPYVKLEMIKSISEQLEQLNYVTFDKRGDLYTLFVERGFNILKQDGIINYIMPNKWLQAGYGKKMRAYFLTKQLHQLIDFGDIQIFQGATTYSVIFTAKNAKPNDHFTVAVLKSANASDFQSNININSEIFETSSFSDDTWVISSQKDKKLLERLKNTFDSLDQFVGGNANYGIKTGLTKAFLISEEVRNKLIIEDISAKNIINPVLRGRDIKKWIGGKAEVYIIGTFPSLNLEINNFPSIKNYFLEFGKQRLEQSGAKGSRKKTSNKWFETQDSISYWEDFRKPKIMYQKFQVKPCFIFDDQGFYCNDSMWIIPSENKSLLGILNSKMGWWLTTKYCTQIQNGCQLIWKYFKQIPIPTLNDELEKQVNEIIELNKKTEKIKFKFINLLISKFPIIKPTKRLQNWHELEFGDFLKELKKDKIKLGLSEAAEWMEYFNEQKEKTQTIKLEIIKIENEIDQLIYQLYGLTEEEIKIVEDATN